MDITSPLWLGVSQTIRRLPTPTTPAGDPKSKPINQPRFPRGDPANSPGPASLVRLANRRRNPVQRAFSGRRHPAQNIDDSRYRIKCTVPNCYFRSIFLNLNFTARPRTRRLPPARILLPATQSISRPVPPKGAPQPMYRLPFTSPQTPRSRLSWAALNWNRRKFRYPDSA